MRHKAGTALARLTMAYALARPTLSLLKRNDLGLGFAVRVGGDGCEAFALSEIRPPARYCATAGGHDLIRNACRARQALQCADG